MNLFARRLNRNLNIEKQGSAIGVPNPVFGMHEYSERRRLKAFSTHRPLLERQPGPIGWRDCASAETTSHVTDDCPRPGVERVGKAFRLRSPPAQEMRPGRITGLSDEQDGLRGHARSGGRRLLVRSEAEAAAQDQAMLGEFGGYGPYRFEMAG